MTQRHGLQKKSIKVTKGFKEVYESIFHYYNEHGSHENSLYISNMLWIYFIPNQSFMNI